MKTDQVSIMATQSYDSTLNRFSLDLHGVLKRDAARVIHKRIEECSRYGISKIEVVYGTPDFFDGERGARSLGTRLAGLERRHYSGQAA